MKPDEDLYLPLNELSTCVVLGDDKLHKVWKPPHRRRLTGGETLCGLVFDEQDVSDPDRAGNGMCLKCYGPDRDKVKEAVKWLS